MKLVTNIKKANCITHSGTMHADEVFATAFLDLYLKNVKVYRTTTIPQNLKENVIIYDIGRGKFDHHQENAKKRDNDITYCSFGLLWQEFGKDYLKQLKIKNIDETFKQIDKDLIEAIDGDDNGIFPTIESPYKVKTLSNIIKLFNPSYNSNQSEQIQFEKAVAFAKIILEQEILNISGKVAAKEKVLKALTQKENNTLILDEYMPYEQALLNEEEANDIYFVVFPSNRGGYAIKTVPISTDDYNKRLDLPKEWRGKVDMELENISGIKGLRFCHLTGFMATCDTLETAKKIIDTAISKSKSESEINLDKMNENIYNEVGNKNNNN